MRAALVAVILLTLTPLPARAQEVLDRLQNGIDLVGAAVERSFARALPLPAAAAGVSYSFDPVTGNFRRDASTYGQVYLERADPLGARHFNVSFVYQYVELSKIDGHDADNLQNAAPIPIEGLLAAFEMPRLNIGAQVHQFLFAGTYGITEDIEASIAVPVVYSDLNADVPFTVAGQLENGELIVVQDNVSESDHVVGVGDVMLRGKYRFLELDDFHFAAGLLLRFPSGDEEQLQGIGYFEVTPSIIASTRIFMPATWARLQGYFNGGIGFDTEDVGASEARWGFGLDWGMTDDFTTGIAFLAQNQFARVAPPGTFTVPACQADVVTCAIDPSVRVGTQNLFGLSGERPDYYNLSIGGRAALWRDTLFGFVNVAIPLNDGFVRTELVPLIGFEGTF
jgi:hypothetical protein